MKEKNKLKEEKKLIIKFDASLYDKVAVLKTCYIFQDRCHTKTETEKNSSIKVILTPKKESADLQQIENQFWDELIDQQVRYENDNLFSDIRRLIVEQAFRPVSFADLKNKIKKHAI